jgi:hypothetical protein
MKKFLLFALTAISSLYASAQVIKKGDKLLGGNLSAYYRQSEPVGPEYNYYSNIGILPSYGKAVKNNLVLGTRLNLSFYHSESLDNSDHKTFQTSYGTGIGIFLRKYKPIQNRFGLYFENEISGVLSFQEYRYSSLPDRYRSAIWGASYSFKPGIFYKFSDFILGEANFGGAQVRYTKNKYTDGELNADLSLLRSFTLGVNFILNGKKKAE